MMIQRKTFLESQNILYPQMVTLEQKLTICINNAKYFGSSFLIDLTNTGLLKSHRSRKKHSFFIASFFLKMIFTC